LLVHGPLSLVLMLAALRASLIQIQLQSSSSAKTAAQSAGWIPMTKSINYSNLAPLYVDEEMRVCLRRATKPPDGPDLRWDVWVEGPEGRLAVKATAVTTGSTP
jgi:hydroxyacyl-ACP dehydratase HTD2-like protein with hotdog domain